MLTRLYYTRLLSSSLKALTRYVPQSRLDSAASAPMDSPRRDVFGVSKHALAELLARLILQSQRDQAESLTILYDEGKLEYVIAGHPYAMASPGAACITDLARFIATCADLSIDKPTGVIQLNHNNLGRISVGQITENKLPALRLTGWPSEHTAQSTETIH